MDEKLIVQLEMESTQLLIDFSRIVVGRLLPRVCGASMGISFAPLNISAAVLMALLCVIFDSHSPFLMNCAKDS